MSDIVLQWKQDEVLRVKECLEKLFYSQGKVVNIDRVSFFLSELKNSKYPVSQICDGIRSLYQADLREVKLADILHSIADVSKNKPNIDEKCMWCVWCEGCGMVSMVATDTGNRSAFACVCDSGALPGNSQYARWDGQEYQRVRGVNYRLYDCHVMKKPIDVVEMNYKIANLEAKKIWAKKFETEKQKINLGFA
jgi:hypothetical protein